MAAAENLENQQTSIKDYRKTERYPKKLNIARNCGRQAAVTAGAKTK